MSNESNTKGSAFDLSIPLSEWISFKTKIFGTEPSGGENPDEYILSALQIAASLADQVCKVDENSDQLSHMPTPGAQDWIDHIAVRANGDASSNIRAEILPSLLSTTAGNNDSKQARNNGILYSLGLVFYELFSRGKRPDGPQIQTGATNELNLLEGLDPLPFDQGEGISDIEAFSGVDLNGDDLLAIDDLNNADHHAIDDLQDNYNDIWGNNDVEESLNGQNPRKKESASNKNITYAKTVETVKDKGVPTSVCDLISNMLGIADERHGGDKDAYRCMSDVRDDLLLMLDKPSIYLYDQDMGTLSTTGLKFGDTLYGRKAELSTIIDAYRRSAVGESESVVISGKSGTGKSFLAVEVGRYVISNRGIFLTGKFDQLKQGKPFSALAWAFNHFCDYLVRDRTLASVKQKLAQQVICTLGRDAYYLTKLIPTLAIILGLEAIGCNHDEDNINAQKRLQMLLCQFVQVISTSFTAPVTLFLDDLQWADPASIAAVNQLLLGGGLNSQNQNGHFFFLGCYRKGEVDGAVNDDMIPSTQVELDSIDEETLGTMVSETLCLSPRLTRNLSSIIYHKTKGNPLFVTRLMISLSKDNLLRASLRRRRWEWDEEKILCQKLSDDVAEFLLHTISALPIEVKSTLSILSCFGSSVSSAFVKTLERVLHKSLRGDIETAVAEGLLDEIEDQYRFSHDRIQEAAYNMMNYLDRCRFHFSHGMALAPSHNEKEAFLFTAVNQLNLAGPEAVEDKTQYAIVANLNLRAGKEAMEMSDFEAAYSYFDNGITFLRKKHWEEHYTLSLELFNLAANCALANGDIISLKLLSQQVIKKAQSFEDTLNVTYFITCSLQNSSRLPVSVEKGLDILSKLGVDLRGCGSSVEACVNMTKDVLSAYTYDELLNAKRMTDSKMTMAMKFLGKLMVGFTQIKPKSAPYVAQQIIQISLSHGMNTVSPIGFAYFGSYAAKLGDIRGGYNYVKLACSLLDKLGSRENAGEVMCIRTHVLSYIEPLQATLEYDDEGYAAAIATGDITSAALNIYSSYVTNFYAGVKLQTTREKGDDVINFMQKKNMVIFLTEMQLMQHSIRKLIGIDEEPKHNLAEEENIANNLIKTTYIFQKSYISFMFRLYDDTKGYAEKYLSCVTSSACANILPSQSFHAFYIGLISFWLARNSRGYGDQCQWHKRGNKSKVALKKWVESSRWTFENKW